PADVKCLGFLYLYVGRYPRNNASRNTESLAREIIANHGVPAEYPEDALHIALAAIGGVDFVVTWNFAHINNPFTKMRIRQTVEEEDLICPQIVSPDELIGESS
ncbi:MAG: hypothetical protein BECKG1743E_GA0114224_111394, partial [Candidatus Kentron sp. G]